MLREVKSAARTAILSNAWPSQRSRMAELEVTDVVHESLLSCAAQSPPSSAVSLPVGAEFTGTAVSAQRETHQIDRSVGISRTSDRPRVRPSRATRGRRRRPWWG